MENRKRDYALDLLKFICSIIFVLTHYEAQFGVHFPVISFGFGKLYMGIVNELFFIVSGYLAFNSVKKILNGLSFNMYFSSRVIRLVPLAAISTLLYGIMTYITRHGADFSVWKLIVTALGMNAGGPFNEMFVNSHLWYLSVLLLCHAVFFICIRLSQRLNINWRYSCFFMVVFGASVSGVTEWNSLPFINFAAACGYMSFFMGVLIAAVLAQHKPNVAATLISLFAVVCFTLLLIFKYEIMLDGILYLFIFVYYPPIIVLLESKPVQSLLDLRFFGFLGQISFGIYIWHMEFNVLLSSLDSFLGLGINFASRWTELAVVLMNIAIGIASFYLLEKPVTAALKKRFG